MLAWSPFGHYVTRRQLRAIFQDQIQDLKNLESEEKKELDVIQRQVQKQVEEYSQTPKGKEAMEKMISVLQRRGITREDAAKKALRFVVERTMTVEKEKLTKQYASQRQEIMQRHAQAMKEYAEIDEFLQMT